MMTAGPGTAVIASVALAPAFFKSPLMMPATASGSTIMLFCTADDGTAAEPNERMVNCWPVLSTSRNLSVLEPMSRLT